MSARSMMQASESDRLRDDTNADAVLRAPMRVRVLGDLFHGRLPERPGLRTVYVGRGAPGLPASPFANPHRVGLCRICGTTHDLDGVIGAYAHHLAARPDLVDAARRDLPGADLACWCQPGPCHGEVLLAVAAGADPRGLCRPGDRVLGGRAVVMSIRAPYADAILTRRKRVEFRRRPPGPGVEVLIYRSGPAAGRGIVGVFTAGDVVARTGAEHVDTIAGPGISVEDLNDYAGGPDELVSAISIQNLRRFPDPMPLATIGLARPPQSWQYLEPHQLAQGLHHALC